MALYSIWNMLLDIRIIILSFVNSCPDCVAGETKAFTSQCKLREGHDGIRNYDVHRLACNARIMDTMGIFSKICYLDFNQFDATSKVIYRHEIVCTGNTV